MGYSLVLNHAGHVSQLFQVKKSLEKVATLLYATNSRIYFGQDESYKLQTTRRKVLDIPIMTLGLAS